MEICTPYERNYPDLILRICSIQGCSLTRGPSNKQLDRRPTLFVCLKMESLLMSIAMFPPQYC